MTPLLRHRVFIKDGGGVGRLCHAERQPCCSDSDMCARCRFFMLRGDPTETVPKLVHETGAALLVTDFGPLRLGREWRTKARPAATVCITGQVQGKNFESQP
jgi:hypothetical protein